MCLDVYLVAFLEILSYCEQFVCCCTKYCQVMPYNRMYRTINGYKGSCLDSSCTLLTCILFPEFEQAVLLVFKARQLIFHLYSCLDLGHLIYCSDLHFSFAYSFSFTLHQLTPFWYVAFSTFFTFV
jgi:hypothetical protein